MSQECPVCKNKFSKVPTSALLWVDLKRAIFVCAQESCRRVALGSRVKYKKILQEYLEEDISVAQPG